MQAEQGLFNGPSCHSRAERPGMPMKCLGSASEPNCHKMSDLSIAFHDVAWKDGAPGRLRHDQQACRASHLLQLVSMAPPSCLMIYHSSSTCLSAMLEKLGNACLHAPQLDTGESVCHEFLGCYCSNHLAQWPARRGKASKHPAHGKLIHCFVNWLVSRLRKAWAILELRC